MGGHEQNFLIQLIPDDVLKFMLMIDQKFTNSICMSLRGAK